MRASGCDSDITELQYFPVDVCHTYFEYQDFSNGITPVSRLQGRGGTVSGGDSVQGRQP